MTRYYEDDFGRWEYTGRVLYRREFRVWREGPNGPVNKTQVGRLSRTELRLPIPFLFAHAYDRFDRRTIPLCDIANNDPMPCCPFSKIRHVGNNGWANVFVGLERLSGYRLRVLERPAAIHVTKREFGRGANVIELSGLQLS